MRLTTAPAGDSLVLCDDRGRVRLVTLNRPERLNAFSDELLRSLAEQMAAAALDDSIHAVVLTGAGRAFSSGADLAEMARSHQAEPDAPKPGKALFADLQQRLESFPKPLIAAVNGLGVGFGFTLLGYCDFVFVAQGARLRTPFSQLGLSPEGSSSYLFPLRMGWSAAARALMRGDWFSSEDLVDCGFALEAVPDADVVARALEFAAGFADCPLQSLTATKALMLEAHLPHVRQARQLENEVLSRLIGTSANREAVAAFARRGTSASPA